jgi:hypothetical protein
MVICDQEGKRFPGHGLLGLWFDQSADTPVIGSRPMPDAAMPKKFFALHKSIPWTLVELRA